MIKPPDAGTVLGGLLRDYLGRVMASEQPLRMVKGSLSTTNTPNWKTLTRYERKYEVPWHPFVYSREVWDQIPAGKWGASSIFNGPQYQYGYKYAVGPYYNTAWTVWGFWPWTVTEAQRKALSKLQGKVARMSVNLAQAYGERRQTVGLLTESVKRLAFAAKAVKNGNFGYAMHLFANYGRPARGVTHFKQTANNLANYWLEFQYGWRPLLSDITGSLEAIAGAYANYKPIRFEAFYEASSAKKRFFGDLPLAPGWKVSFDIWEDVTERARYVLEVEEEQSVMQSLASTGVTNPALLAWELLPYSFVVDWFLPVGNYLQQLEYARGLTFKRGTFSLARKGSAYLLKPLITEIPGGDSWIYNQLRAEGSVVMLHTSKQRTVLGGFPYQEFPSFKPQLGVERALSAISLITQLFSGRKTVR